MKIHGIKREWKSPFFLYCKKHHCPICNELLKTVNVSKVVNSRSEEAVNFDFSSDDGYMVGNIKFIWTELRCEKCNRTYTVQEIKNREKQLKRKNKR